MAREILLSGEQPLFDVGTEVWIPDFENTYSKEIEFVKTKIVSLIFEMKKKRGKRYTSFTYYITEYEEDSLIPQDYVFSSEEEAIEVMGESELDDWED